MFSLFVNPSIQSMETSKLFRIAANSAPFLLTKGSRRHYMTGHYQSTWRMRLQPRVFSPCAIVFYRFSLTGNFTGLSVSTLLDCHEHIIETAFAQERVSLCFACYCANTYHLLSSYMCTFAPALSVQEVQETSSSQTAVMLLSTA